MKHNKEERAKKIGQWVKTILATIAIIAAFIGAFYFGPFLATLLKGYLLGAEDKYAFFRDILLINLSIMAIIFGAIAVWIHVFISERVENRIEKSVGNQSESRDKNYFKYTLGTAQLNNGYIFWQLYKTTKEKQFLNSAIQLTEEANFLFKGLDEKVYAYKLAKCQIMNNLGYYLAEKGNPKDIQYAITCGEFILKRLESFPEKRASWMDTYEYIKSKKGEN